MIDQERTDRQAIRELIRRPAFMATVAAVTVALVVGVLAWSVGRPADGTVAGAGHPSATGSVTSGGAEPSPSLDPWASGEPVPGAVVTSAAVLTAVGATGDVVPLDAGFRLASVDSTPASELAARLTVQPGFAFSIVPEPDDRAALLTPAEPLQPGLVYRFALSGAGGELLDSWAFQARQPLRVVGTIPSHQATDVPIDTGIEITFHQDGVTDAASHVTIKPKTRGRFEQHERTLVFVPDQPLARGTVYNVTVSRGVTVGSTGEATEGDTRFQFETRGTAKARNAVAFTFPNTLIESPTAERPAIGLWWSSDAQKPKMPKTARIDVYRLADLAAGIKAFQELQARLDWSRWSSEGLVDMKGLPRVATVDARLNPMDGSFWVRLPRQLPAGWYLVHHPDARRPIQAVLQVTDIAGYLAISETRTLVWANDLKQGGPIARATVASDGTEIGRTGVDGLAMGPTPKGLLPQVSQPCAARCDPVVTVRSADGRAIFLPTDAQNQAEAGFDGYWWSDADPDFWSLFHTDRNRYRPTDTVNLWGTIRDRDSGKVPAAVTLRLNAQSYDDGNPRPPVTSLTATPDRTGAFTASMPLAGQPDGDYAMEMLVGGDVVRTSYLVVGPIAKPAYRLAITTGRRVYVAGDRIKVTAQANFYEGTPVIGVPLRIGAYLPGTDDFVDRKATTDAGGTAVYRTTARAEPTQEGPREAEFSVHPARAEEGEITGASRQFQVFPSRRTVDATARITKGRVRVSGSVHLVDLDRLESEVSGGKPLWELDPRGAAIGGATVTVRFVELVPVRRQEGTRYDFIEKKAVQVYVDEIDERAAGSVRVRTAANGTYTASIPATAKDHDYRISVSVRDADGLVARASEHASRHPWSVYQRQNATLQPTDVTADESATFGIGDRVDLTMREPSTKQATGDGTRYLFFVAQRGLRDAIVQSSPRFVTTFQRWAAPNMNVGGVRFNGHGYVGAVRFDAQFKASDRRLRVDLSAAAARYAPGDLATVDVRTRDASGTPIAATVILRAVDEKLYTIGAASADDPLTELYAPVQSGVVGTYRSHQSPLASCECGDTTGGGGDDGRADFRDSLLFKTIDTNANGRGSVSFRVSDDLTSWRVTASALTSGLDAGVGSVLVPVGLPFFVDASIAPEYLRADRPSIAIRTYGSDLAPGDPVTIQLSSKSLGYDSGPIRATAFDTTAVPLPPLHLGTQTVTISATTGAGAGARTDRLTRSFTVVETHLMRARTTYVDLPASGPFGGGEGLTTVIVSDASGGRYLPLLTDLASGGGARLDRGLAAEVASSLLVSRFASAPTEPDGAFEATRYQTPDGGLALLPYSSSDLELSALVALTAPDRIERSRLASYLRGVRADGEETRERRMFALAGLAGLHDPVLPAVRLAANDGSLTTRERLMIGLGAAALGDVTTARSIAAALIVEHGERLGDQARLRVGSSAADITTATAFMAVLSAALGDDIAPLLWAYVEANPTVDQLQVLPAVAYVTNSLDRLPVQPATFAYAVEGARTVVDLEGGNALELTLTAPQLATLTIERITGSIGVTTNWRESVRPAALKPDPDVTITRSVSPSTSVDSADLVRVDLMVTFGPQAAGGCHQVTELVPSGLTPVGFHARWIDSEDGRPAMLTDSAEEDVFLPYAQSGPRVFFCAEVGLERSAHLRYNARVVTPGTYAWEPAIAESRSQEGHAALTANGRIVIR